MSFDPKIWQGCIPMETDRRPLGIASLENDIMVPGHGWHRWIIPTHAQDWPSCAGDTMANVKETMLRWKAGDVIPKGFGIDGYKIWKHGRQIYYGGNLDGGLSLFQAFIAAIELGIFSPLSEFVEVAPEWKAIANALADSVLAAGSQVHAGWQNPADNGCIDHRPRAQGQNRGHAWTVIGNEFKDTGGCFLHGLNTWGQEWGDEGRFVMTIEEFLEGHISGPVAIREPEGWEHDEGWKKWTTEIR